MQWERYRVWNGCNYSARTLPCAQFSNENRYLPPAKLVEPTVKRHIQPECSTKFKMKFQIERPFSLLFPFRSIFVCRRIVKNGAHHLHTICVYVHWESLLMSKQTPEQAEKKTHYFIVQQFSEFQSTLISLFKKYDSSNFWFNDSF